MNRLMRKALRYANSAWNCFGATVVILLYHRISIPEKDPQLLCVDPENFASHIEIIRKRYRILSLKNLVTLASEKRLPSKSVAITFDDGYSDNLYQGIPILEKFEAPATFYISSLPVLNQKLFWWDELEDIFLRGRPLPETLRFNVNQKEIFYGFSNQDIMAAAESKWCVLESKTQNVCQIAYMELCRKIGDVDPESRNEIIDHLKQWAGIARVTPACQLILNREELVTLATHPLSQIGAHTQQHVRLSSLPPQKQLSEIEGSKVQLENIAGTSIDTFSYPFGTSDDYTPETVAMVRQTGFESGCGNHVGLVNRWSNVYDLPRFGVQNIRAEMFEKMLAGIFA